MAFAGALAISIPVAAFARRARIDVLLAGIAHPCSGSVTTGLQFGRILLQPIVRFNGLWGPWLRLAIKGPGCCFLAVISVIGLLLQTRALESLVAGEEQAFSQGVDVAKVRMRVLLFGALGVAACVAWCGPIAFVGLVVPHLVRLGLGSVRRVLIPMSGVVGAAFLVLCDSVARVLLSGQELPVGVLTAAVVLPDVNLDDRQAASITLAGSFRRLNWSSNGGLGCVYQVECWCLVKMQRCCNNMSGSDLEHRFLLHYGVNKTQ